MTWATIAAGKANTPIDIRSYSDAHIKLPLLDLSGKQVLAAYVDNSNPFYEKTSTLLRTIVARRPLRKPSFQSWYDSNHEIVKSTFRMLVRYANERGWFIPPCDEAYSDLAIVLFDYSSGEYDIYGRTETDFPDSSPYLSKEEFDIRDVMADFYVDWSKWIDSIGTYQFADACMGFLDDYTYSWSERLPEELEDECSSDEDEYID